MQQFPGFCDRSNNRDLAPEGPQLPHYVVLYLCRRLAWALDFHPVTPAISDRKDVWKALDRVGAAVILHGPEALPLRLRDHFGDDCFLKRRHRCIVAICR
jgi:hypothetical protein